MEKREISERNTRLKQSNKHISELDMLMKHWNKNIEGVELTVKIDLGKPYLMASILIQKRRKL